MAEEATFAKAAEEALRLKAEEEAAAAKAAEKEAARLKFDEEAATAKAADEEAAQLEPEEEFLSVFKSAMAEDKESIPDAPPGAAPDLDAVRAVQRQGPASTGGHSAGGKSAYSMVSTTLTSKGLDRVPVAEQVFSRRTGKPYYRYRVPPSSKFVTREYVIKLGFAWYPSKTDPMKGNLHSVNEKGLIGKFYKHEAAKAVLGNKDDIANMDDFIDADDAPTDEEFLERIEEETEGEQFSVARWLRELLTCHRRMPSSC